jgi:hypothetical protein
MQKIIIILLLSLFFQPLKAEEAQTIKPITQVLRTTDWYLAQAKLWEAKLGKDKSNVESWMNYYLAQRYSLMTNFAELWDVSKEVILMELDGTIEEMSKNVSQSYEYNFIKWYNAPSKKENIKYLEKAYSIDSSRTEIYPGLINHYIYQNDTTKLKKICGMWHRSMLISPAMLNYSYNLLMSVGQNALLIVEGDNDTYPVLVSQYAMEVRRDVRLLNIYMAGDKKYKEDFLKRIGVPPFDKTVSDFKDLNKYNSELILHITAYLGNVYFPVSFTNSLYSAFEDKVYLEGLAFKYSTNSYDKTSILVRNYEKRFALDYLENNFSYETPESFVNYMNLHYIFPFIFLRNHYQILGEYAKVDKIDFLLNLIIQKGYYHKHLVPHLYE